MKINPFSRLCETNHTTTTPTSIQNATSYLILKLTTRMIILTTCQFLFYLFTYNATGFIPKTRAIFLYEHSVENRPGFRKLNIYDFDCSIKEWKQVKIMNTNTSHQNRSLIRFNQINLQNSWKLMSNVVKLSTWIAKLWKIFTSEKVVSS